ncbi:truncated hemoglobin GlbN [Seminavis robusta]|uniref:Truncated hemoglobin GlbN n=1 Tax=Seminavis robusta TaxID=568900 RepID=A0A9N8DJK7_9STRA|nr:truncated hemoglobin GlbN [Seminavis robusta]|eukprot:Sro177_g077690.1 truncated hemoglobin GlbN (206) ;mRNA; r:27742-28359
MNTTANTTVSTPAVVNAQPSLLERLGGNDVLEVVLEGFYFRLLCDEDLLEIFDGIDTAWLKVHQHKFLTLAFNSADLSGKAVGKHIARGHARLWAKGLSERHFDLVVEHLVEALLEMDTEQSLMDDVVAVVRPLRTVFEENALKHRQQQQASSNSKIASTSNVTAVPNTQTKRDSATGSAAKKSTKKRSSSVSKSVFSMFNARTN